MKENLKKWLSPTEESKKLPYLLPAFAFSLLLLIWELLTRYSGWSSEVFPGPIKVISSMWELYDNGTLVRHSIASLYRVTAGFYLSIIFGIPLGIIIGRLTIIKYLLNPVIQFLRPISPLAWIPLSMLWFGIGDMPAIFLIFLSSFFPLVVSTAIAVRSIASRFFYVAVNFNFSKIEIITKVIVPAIIPSILTAIRISLGIAWLVVVAAEMIAVKSGLGYLILDSRNALRMDYVMDGMIAIGSIGLFLDYIMKKLSTIKYAHWGSL